jgi:cysteine desulfurase/selenocysteine lyase
MANEMFSALPDELQQTALTAARVVLPPNSAFTGNPYAAAPSPTAPAAPGILASLSEAQPRAFVATPERSIAPDARSSASTAPAVPGGGVAPTAGPEFGFLQDARPIFQEPAAEPAAQNTPTQASGKPLPSEEGLAAIPLSLPADSQSLQLTQPPAPAVPSALGVVDSSAVPTFSFMEDARPLF